MTAAPAPPPASGACVTTPRWAPPGAAVSACWPTAPCATLVSLAGLVGGPVLDQTGEEVAA